LYSAPWEVIGKNTCCGEAGSLIGQIQGRMGGAESQTSRLTTSLRHFTYRKGRREIGSSWKGK
jgi:hypothetical protein